MSDDKTIKNKGQWRSDTDRMTLPKVFRMAVEVEEGRPQGLEAIASTIIVEVGGVGSRMVNHGRPVRLSTDDWAYLTIEETLHLVDNLLEAVALAREATAATGAVTKTAPK